MFSGTPDRPDRSRRAVSGVASSRRSSRSALSLAPSVSGQSTPRAGSPQASQLPTPRAISSGLHAASRALSASPAPPPRRARSSVAPSEVLSSNFDSDELAYEKLLVRDTSYVVLEQKGLPVEVEEVLRDADPYTDPFRASLDTNTGFAYLVSRGYCYVWNWSRRSTATTTYLFPLPTSLSLPASVSIFSPLSYAALVPTSTTRTQTREPGLLIVSTTGEIRYWDSISLALSGVERYTHAIAPLSDNELVRSLTPRGASTFLLATSHARLLLVSLSSTGGKALVAVKALDRPLGWAGSMWSAVFGGKPDPKAGILAVALGRKVAYAVAAKSVQVWTMDEQGGRMAVELDLFAGVLEALKGAKTGNEEWALNKGHVEILDAKVTDSGALAVLVSHVTEHTASNSLSYAVALLELGITIHSMQAIGVKRLRYQAHPDPRPLSSPRLSLPGGDAAFVVFVDAVVMFSLSSDADFEEAFPLRHSTHRFLGNSTASSTPSLTLLTSTGTLISVEITGTLPAIESSDEANTRKLKGKIEQAIFFGATEADNPLAFDLMPDFQGDLITAAETVSTELLASGSPSMPIILDLRAQLADRAARARGLIEYINSNGLNTKLSQSSRRQLSWDAERLAAAASLWHYQNSRMGDSESLLALAIETYMDEIGEGLVDDPIRMFFRAQVSAMGAVLETITKLTKGALSASASAPVMSQTLQEANHIVLLVFNAVNRHRADAGYLYGLDPNYLPLEAWSSTPTILECLQWHFDTTDAIIRDRTRDLGTIVDGEPRQYSGRGRAGAIDSSNQQLLQAELKNQMTSLADFVFAFYEERILFLTSTAGDSGTSPELRIVTDRYFALRPRLIRSLVAINKVPNAYTLAERHRDFQSLVELCNHAKHGSAPRIKLFMEKYEADFAFALYEFYVRSGQFRVLLEQDEDYGRLLTTFLDHANLPRISWLNDIAVGQYDAATEALMSVAHAETNLAQKKLLLSIGKLTQVAQATMEDIETEPVQRAIEGIDDNLDLVNSQESLRIAFMEVLSVSDSKQLALEQQGESVADRVAPSLASHPALHHLYAKLCTQLLRGEVLSAEGLIDLLTYKEEYTPDESSAFSTALEILARAKDDLPEARRQLVLQSIWRRVYLRDDWAALNTAINLKDEEVAEALKATALYSTIAKSARSDHPSSMYLEPTDSFFDGDSDALASRFPDEPQLVELLTNEFEDENIQLREALVHHKLGSFVEEIGRLLEVGDLADFDMTEE